MQGVRKLRKACKTPKCREHSPTSNQKKKKKEKTKKKKGVRRHIALCSENTRANLAVAVRGLARKLALVAMNEGSRDCKSISTSKMYD